MLERFWKAKEHEIAVLRELAAKGHLPAPKSGKRPPFAGSLKNALQKHANMKNSPAMAVIAEYKRASPSQGDINLALSPEEAAAAYAAAGAGAISVLTEEMYFKGNLDFIDAMAGALPGVGLPLLRKDFLFHPLQVDATAATSASAVLVIVRMVDDATLGALLERCDNLGLEAVVEVFDAPDLDRAKKAGAAIIQVNNRDLDTLVVDMGVSVRLAEKKEPGEFWISASGVRSREDIDTLRRLGFDAVLVGTALMSGPDPGAKLAALMGGGRHAYYKS